MFHLAMAVLTEFDSHCCAENPTPIRAAFSHSIPLVLSRGIRPGERPEWYVMRPGRENEACQKVGISNTQVGDSSARQELHCGCANSSGPQAGARIRGTPPWCPPGQTDMLVLTDSRLSSLTADPLVGSIATQYMTNRAEHDRMARQWTKRYAT